MVCPLQLQLLHHFAFLWMANIMTPHHHTYVCMHHSCTTRLAVSDTYRVGHACRANL